MAYRRLLLIVCIICLIISGCSGPRVKRGDQTPVHPGPHLALVQAAVDGFYESHHVLPIVNSELDTPVYEKYKVDFARLKSYGYIQSIPENAFENGGLHHYVMVDVEDEAKVKLLHIPSVRDAKEVEQRMLDYAKTHGGLPLGEPVYPEWYEIDYAKLGLQEVRVQSVFTNQYVGLLVHTSGVVSIDYASDIMQLIMQNDIEHIDTDVDLRTLLVEHSYFVPAHTQPYYWVDGTPVISPNVE